MTTIPLWWYLIVSAGLFSLGMYGALTRRNAVNVLMAVELMLNAVNINAVAFWRYITPAYPVIVGGKQGLYLTNMDGQVFAVFVIALAAAEAAVGLAMIIAIYRSRRSVALDTIDTMKG